MWKWVWALEIEFEIWSILIGDYKQAIAGALSSVSA